MNKCDRYFTLSDEQLQDVDAACETFERALASEQPIGIEACLAAVAAEIRSPLFRELLAIELERQTPSDRPRQSAAYRVRFPEFASDVRQVFAEIANSTGRGVPECSSVIPGNEIETVLGRGMGVVYKALHQKLKRTVAL